MEMRKLYAETNTPLAEIASRFGMSTEGCEKICRGETWTHIPILKPNRESARHAKIAPETVREIRSLRANTKLTVKQIAHRFGISIWTANDIIYNRTRTNIHPQGINPAGG